MCNWEENLKIIASISSLLEDSAAFYLLEDSTAFYLFEDSAAFYLLEDSAAFYLLEDSATFYLLEDSTAAESSLVLGLISLLTKTSFDHLGRDRSSFKLPPQYRPSPCPFPKYMLCKITDTTLFCVWDKRALKSVLYTWYCTLSKARLDTEPKQVPAHPQEKQPEREGAKKAHYYRKVLLLETFSYADILDRLLSDKFCLAFFGFSFDDVYFQMGLHS